MEPETLYSSAYSPNPRSARDVLAFVLTPIAAFAAGDEEEREAIAEVLESAKAEAIQRWFDLQATAKRS
jgi:hypothetical protein